VTRDLQPAIGSTTVAIEQLGDHERPHRPVEGTPRYGADWR
jgi:hypothetical protein